MVDAFEAGLWLFWVRPHDVVAVPRPVISVQDDRLHCPNGPAVEWPNGAALWFWRGVKVTEDVIMRPEAITIARIDAETNAEVRRVMVERYGKERFICDGGAKLIDESRWGKLWQRRMANDDPVMMVEVVNSTAKPDGSSNVYFLNVHPELRPLLSTATFGAQQKLTALNAVASTFGLRGEEYAPMVET